jgi:hypothetical protein
MDRVMFHEEQRFSARWILLLAILPVIGIAVLLTGHVATEVDGRTIKVEVWPIQLSPVELAIDDLASVEARDYDPLREFGGWGVRNGRRGAAYNAYGSRGVQLVLTGGRRVLVGSQRADELADVIRRVQGSHLETGSFLEMQYFRDAHGFIWVPMIGLLAAFFAITILASGRLVTEVRADAIYVRFAPFHRSFRRFPWASITSADARTYRPIREYGGWGLRGFGRNRAYSVRGNRGLQIVFKDGRRLLIGSDRADALGQAIARARTGAGAT